MSITVRSSLPAPPPPPRAVLPPPEPWPSTRRYRPVARLTGWVEGLTIAGVVASLTLAVAALTGIEVRGDLVLVPDAVAALLIAEAVVVVGLRVATHLWTYRLSSNAAALGATGLEHSPAASIWWWYVPIAALFKPPKVVNELAKVSDPAWVPGEQRWDSRPPSPLVGAWWAAFVVVLFGGQVALGVGLESTAARGALTFLGVAMAVALGAWWRVVRRIGAQHRHRATRLARLGLLDEAFADHART